MDVHCRFSQSNLNIWKISFATILLSFPNSIGKPNFHPVNSCTDIKLKDIPVDVFQSCSETSTAIHCLPDENNNLGLSCFQVTWISKDKCPSYNSYQGNMDEKDCSTNYNGICPGDLYKSTESVLYTGCYIKELIPKPTTVMKSTSTIMTITTVAPTGNEKPSSGAMQNVSSVAVPVKETNQMDDPDCGNGWMIATILLIVLYIASVAAAAVLIYKYFPESIEKIRGAFGSVQKAQNESLPPEKHKMLEARNGIIPNSAEGRPVQI